MNRGLKEICARHGISVPPELEVIHSRRHSLSPGQRSSMSMPSLPSSQISGSTLSEAHSTGDAAMVSRTPSEASYDSDFLERLAAARVSVGNPASSMPRSGSQPPSPVSPATAVLQMMQQLQQVIPSNADNANFKVIWYFCLQTVYCVYFLSDNTLDCEDRSKAPHNMHCILLTISY